MTTKRDEITEDCPHGECICDYCERVYADECPLCKIEKLERELIALRKENLKWGRPYIYLIEGDSETEMVPIYELNEKTGNWMFVGWKEEIMI